MEKILFMQKINKSLKGLTLKILNSKDFLEKYEYRTMIGLCILRVFWHVFVNIYNREYRRIYWKDIITTSGIKPGIVPKLDHSESIWFEITNLTVRVNEQERH